MKRLNNPKARLILIVSALILIPPGVQLLIMQWQDIRLSRQLRRLQATHQQLSAERERLQQDPVYVEGITRSTFKVAQPGELVVPLTGGAQPDQRPSQSHPR